jgi:uncharacterized protein GlcG (DUF336 family)
VLVGGGNYDGHLSKTEMAETAQTTKRKVMKMKTTQLLALLLGLSLCIPTLRANDTQNKGNNGKGNQGKDNQGHDDQNNGNNSQKGLCNDLPSQAQLAAALKSVVNVGGTNNSGFGLNMWATTVNRDGEVCAVAFSGQDRGDQWPGSRVISAQKANTANSFSLPNLALSTANLYTAVQPGGTLFGLQHSNPVDTGNAYRGPSKNYGQANDPLVAHKIGGVNVFGGGLALYNKDHKLVGALGISGDTSCTDHVVAWKVRKALGLDYVPAGVSPTGDDNMVHDSGSGWFHPVCSGSESNIVFSLPTTYPISH